MTIGERIRKIRVEKLLTQRQVGMACGIADSNIRAYELGKANPKIETLQKIANALGVPVTDLMYDDPPKTFSEFYGRLEKVGVAASKSAQEATTKAFRTISQKGIETAGELQKNNCVSQKSRLDAAYRLLNDKGQRIAVERVEELSKIPDYQKEKPSE